MSLQRKQTIDFVLWFHIHDEIQNVSWLSVARKTKEAAGNILDWGYTQKNVKMTGSGLSLHK